MCPPDFSGEFWESHIAADRSGLWYFQHAGKNQQAGAVAHGPGLLLITSFIIGPILAWTGRARNPGRFPARVIPCHFPSFTLKLRWSSSVWYSCAGTEKALKAIPERCSSPAEHPYRPGIYSCCAKNRATNLACHRASSNAAIEAPPSAQAFFAKYLSFYLSSSASLPLMADPVCFGANVWSER